MSLPTDYPKQIGSSDIAQVAVYGIQVWIVPGDPTFEIELQRAPDSSGAPNVGAAVTLPRLPPAPASGIVYTDALPLDGAKRYYRYRHVRTGWTAGPYSTWSRSAIPTNLLMNTILPPTIITPTGEHPTISGGSVDPSGMDSNARNGLTTGKVDLVMNGDFELKRVFWKSVKGSDFSEQPWLSVNSSTPYKGTYAVDLAAQASASGNAASLVQCQALEDGGMGDIMKIRVAPGEKYRVHCALKASAGTPQVLIGIFVWDDGGVNGFTGNVVNITTAWVEYESIITVPANCHYITCAVEDQLSSVSAYTLSIDDFHLWKQTLSGDLNLGYFDNGTKSANFTIDWNNGDHQRVKLGAAGPLVITLNNPVAGKRYILDVVQDATGSRTVTWPSSVKWAGGTTPTLTTTANRVDQIELFYNGSTTNYRGSAVLNFVD